MQMFIVEAIFLDAKDLGIRDESRRVRRYRYDAKVGAVWHCNIRLLEFTPVRFLGSEILDVYIMGSSERLSYVFAIKLQALFTLYTFTFRHMLSVHSFVLLEAR